MEGHHGTWLGHKVPHSSLYPMILGFPPGKLACRPVLCEAEAGAAPTLWDISIRLPAVNPSILSEHPPR